jgi:TRAP-type mannitol/chloroaromatic compound transport system permease large subunit
MGLLAFPAMLRAGYNVKVGAGAITAGGCLGILIPPSVLLIVYGATAGVSVVKLYAGAFLPGIMLAALYVGYVIVLAKLKPSLMPPLSAEESKVELPAFAEELSSRGGVRALPALLNALKGHRNCGIPMTTIVRNLFVVLLPIIAIALLMAAIYRGVTAPLAVVSTEGLVEMTADGSDGAAAELADPNALQEPEALTDGVQEPPVEGVQEPPVSEEIKKPSVVEKSPQTTAPNIDADKVSGESRPAPTWFWVTLAVAAFALMIFYWMFNFARLEIFKMLLASFFPLAMLIVAVLGSIVFGLATPSEAAAMGSLGGVLLAIAYRRLNMAVLRESAFLTAKTSAMVCWLFVGSSIFSAAFALLGGQEIIERWVLSMDLTPLEFMLMAQLIIFLLGWPLEWTEIIVIFMPIFIPLLAHFNIDPLFFGLLVAINLQTAFLSPPVAMAAFYLKGVSPPHVTLNQIFAGMLPFMAIQIVMLVLLYVFPGIGLWLPNYLYK